MTRKLLWGIIVVLLVTNLTTLLVWVNTKEQDSTSSTNKLAPVVEATEEPVALVGDEKIHHEEWMATLQEQYGEDILREMIDKQVVFQLADQFEVDISNKLIQRELALMETMLPVMDESEIKLKREQWENDVQYRYFLEDLLTKDIGISEKKIKDFYEDHQDQYEFHTTYQFSHIVLPSKETALKVKEELDNGAEFSMLAREYSEDEYTKDKGGYLGYFSVESRYLPSSYYEEAESLGQGEYSSPFQTDQGFVLLQLHRTLPPITFTYEEVKEQIKREIALDYVSGSLSASPLWKEIGVNWIYGD
ncbi:MULTISPECIES: peptidyl-prolyl cis-trans isomerase [Pontibacillus]|uniref:peptidylprolyl isomerase n=1 Tax=Pontibacillus chungwhensis TaxID=265426 RepID=A0ABY8UYD9_9BACI|nr:MULTISPECIES: peptidyl-prolyl cis-trans isomerase [Pontibacillus]MCD5326119.1 peptidyl-prolyl cis-trans isomerase [Pontibacillus sp. HN14]WIF98218.1 peptidyl-prolyl cis-trans isomerase [Pontibacillus chungwhensis]